MTAIELELCEPVALRRARPEDCEAVWRWSAVSDAVRTRRAETVAFIEHARWFARRLADGDAPIWVIEEYHHGVGVVRLDPPEHGRARLSIALAPFARGRGIGRTAVGEACRSWRQPLAAEIFADHVATRACFEACGFRAIAACDGLVTYHWDPGTDVT